MNYFNGEKKFDFGYQMREYETLFNASDEVKELGKSGKMNEIHNLYNSLNE